MNAARRLFWMGVIAGANLGAAAVVVLMVSGCWTIEIPPGHWTNVDTNSPSAWDIHNQFPEHSGGWLMATNSGSVKP